MPRKAKPWWEARKGWYANVNGHRKFFGEHPKGKPKSKKGKIGWNVSDDIWETYNKLLGLKPSKGDAVITILNDFLIWGPLHRAPETTERDKDFCQSFAYKFGALAVSRLDPSHVTEWLSDKDTWNSTTKNNAIRAITRGFNWAVRNRGLQFNPFSGMEKPKAKARKETITDAEFKKLLSFMKDDDPFKDLLIVSYDSLCRPQEIKILRKDHKPKQSVFYFYR